MFCTYTRPRYQVSVYRTIDPLVIYVLVILIISHFGFEGRNLLLMAVHLFIAVSGS